MAISHTNKTFIICQRGAFWHFWGKFAILALMFESKDTPPPTLRVGNLKKKNMFWKVFRWVVVGFGA